MPDPWGGTTKSSVEKAQLSKRANEILDRGEWRGSGVAAHIWGPLDGVSEAAVLGKMVITKATTSSAFRETWVRNRSRNSPKAIRGPDPTPSLVLWGTVCVLDSDPSVDAARETIDDGDNDTNEDGAGQIR